MFPKPRLRSVFVQVLQRELKTDFYQALQSICHSRVCLVREGVTLATSDLPLGSNLPNLWYLFSVTFFMSQVCWLQVPGPFQEDKGAARWLSTR